MRALQLLAFTFFATLPSVFGQYVRIGDGAFGNSNVAGPMNSTTVNNAWGRYAYIWPASLLGNLRHGDTIFSAEFYKDNNVNLQGSPIFTIWMKMTDSTQYGTRPLSFSTATGMSGAKRVYDRNPGTDASGNEGWKRFPFHLGGFVVDTTKGKNLEVFIEYIQTGTQTQNIPWLYENRFSITSLFIGQTRLQTGAGTPADSLRTLSDVHPSMILNYPRADRDLQIMKLYTLGKLPVPLGNPDTIRALVRNVGKRTLTGHKVEVRSRGANLLRDSATLPNLAPGEERFVTLGSLDGSRIGMDTLLAISMRDGNKSNDTASSLRIATANVYSYKDPATPPAGGGIGFNGATGDFVARFSSNTAKAINQITVTYGFGGQNCRIGIWEANPRTGAPGRNVWTSSNFTTQTGNVVIPVWPPVSVSGVFYVGVRQIATQNVAFGYQMEEPVRPTHFFYATPTGDTNWVDFAPGAPFRFLIEPRIQADYDVAVTAVNEPRNRDSLDKYAIKTIAPKATIFNYGAKFADSIFTTFEVWNFGTRIYRATRMDTLSPGISRRITFDSTLLPSATSEHQVIVYTNQRRDQMRDNDTARSVFILSIKRDVAIDAIFEPSQANYELNLDTIFPIVRIQNLGVDRQGPFNVRAEVRRRGTSLFTDNKSFTLNGEQGTIAQFAPYVCRDTGLLEYRVYHELAVDRFRANDTLSFFFRVNNSNDVGFSKGILPAKDTILFPSGTAIAPRAWLNNYGIISQTNNFRVSCRIWRGNTQVYSDTQRVPAYYGPPGMITFARRFVPNVKGPYRISFRAFLPGDQVPANDSLVYNFQVGLNHDHQALSVEFPRRDSTYGIGSGPYRVRARFRNNGYLRPVSVVPFTAQILYNGTVVYTSIRSTIIDTGETRQILFDSSFIPSLVGRHVVRVFASELDDTFRRNDTFYSHFFTERSIDVGVVAILQPPAGSTYRIKQDALFARARIVNESKAAVLTPFQTAFEIRDPLNRIVFARYPTDTIGFGITKETIMPDSFVPERPGKHRLWVMTRLITDQNRFNDTQWIDFNAEATTDGSILRFATPDFSQEFRVPGGLRPAVWVKNTGSSAISGYSIDFRAFPAAGGANVWQDLSAGTALNPGDSLLINAGSNWNISQAGNFRVEARLSLNGDVFSGNDTLSGLLRAVDPTGLRDIAFLQGSRLYPNPTSQTANWQLEKGQWNPATRVRLLHTDGRNEWLSGTRSANGTVLSFDIAHLSSGVYLLEAIQGEATLRVRLMVE